MFSHSGRGERLRIVNVTLTAGARAQSVRTEVGNTHVIIIEELEHNTVPTDLECNTSSTCGVWHTH
jgi:hypothetical protein